MLFRCLLFLSLFIAVLANAQQVKIDVTGRRCAADQQCGGDSTNFKGVLTGATPADVKSWAWNFGEPMAGKNNTAAKQDPRHLYQNRGDYTVRLTATLKSGKILKDSVSVSIFPLPPPVQFFGGKSDTTICETERGKLILDPYKDFGSPPASLKLQYSWYPNAGADTLRTLKVDSSGCHSVTVTDSLTGCAVSAKINVIICAEQLPPPKQYWYFGNGAGIEFAGQDAKPITNGKTNTPEGTSVYTDKKGKLQFYTDGITVFDRTGKAMRIRDKKNPADTTLAGNKNATQAAIIIQQPGCKSCEFIYYIFTTQDINDSTHVLSYSIVDMRLNGGKGEVTALNIPLYSPSTERLTAVKNTKDSSYYIVTHDYKTGNIRSFNLTKQGIAPSKNYPLSTPQTTPNSGEGQMKISTNAKRMGVIVPGPPNNILEIYDYTDTTGAISGKIVINLGPAPPKAYGLEFSEDGKKVYVSMQGDSAKGIASLLLQYDLQTKDSLIIAQSRITIDSTTSVIYGALQYAPDGKIYVALKGKPTLGVINNPNGISKRQINYIEKGLNLGGKTSQLGLPNMVQNEIENSSGPGISVSDTCAADVTKLQAGPWCEKRNETYRWNYDYKGPDISQLPRVPGVQFPYASIIVGLGGFSAPSKQTQTSYKYPRPATYRVALYIKNDCKDTLIIQQLTIKPSPIADLGKDIDECKKSVILDAKDRTPLSEYYWFQDNRPIFSAIKPTLTVTKSGTYVVVTAIDECLAADTIRVRLRIPLPLALGDSLQSLCTGTSLVLNAGTGFVSYNWSNGANTQVISVSSMGKYKVTATDAQGCKSIDSVRVTAKPKANWTVVQTPTASCGANTGTIKLSGFLPVDNYSFKWFKNGQDLGQTGTDLTGLGIGNYSVRIRSSLACDTTANYSINALVVPINLQAISGNPASCESLKDGQIRIAVFNTAAAPATYVLTKVNDPTFKREGPYTDLLLPNSTTIGGLIKDLVPGVYNLILADKDGCQLARSGIVVGIFPPDLVNLGGDKTLCQGQEVVLDAGTKGNTFQWDSGEKTQKITVKTPGTYRVTVSNSTKAQCISVSQVTVKVNPIPVVNVGNPQTVCGNAQALSLSGSPAGGEWSGNGISKTGVFVPSPLLTGNQVLTYTVSLFNCEGKGTKTITVLPSPPQNLLPPSDFWCEDSPKRINAPEIPNASYKWSSGESTTFIQPLSSGKYVLTVTLGTCQSRDTISIIIGQNPTLFNVKSDLTLCVIEGATAVLDPGQSKGWTYNWQPNGEKTRRITVSKDGVYTVTVRSEDDCPTVLPITVVNKCEPRIVVPEIFTPNGDGLNDAMDVFTAHISDFEIKVYNRWGEVVFVSDDPNIKWDGRYREALYPTQSYAWVVTFRSLYFPERPAGTKKGAVVVAK